MLKDVAVGSSRAITAENTKKFITAAQLGAVIRITDDINGDDSQGTEMHSMILVYKDANGLTIYDSLSRGIRLKYFTWSNFASTFSEYKYFKYIKWASTPSNISYSSTNPDDYEFPTRSLYYTSPTMTGSDVAWVQAVLKKLGFSITIDGKYGPTTRDVIKQFQTKYGLEVDGKCGPLTRTKLQSLWNGMKCTHTYTNACDASCNICGATRTPAAHVYSNACDTTCNVCGAVRTVGSHSYSSKITTTATCGADGVCTYTCSVCGHSYTEAIPAMGHDHDAAVIAPDCVNGGYTTYTCSVCGDNYVADATDATGHTECTVEGYAATCTKDGLTDGAKCSVCGEILVAQEAIPAIDHTVVIDPAVESTVTSTGLTEGSHCGVCGTILVAQQVVEKLPTPDLPADAPTFAVDSVTAREGEEFTVAIRTLRNSGIVSMKLKVGYDADVLELVSVAEQDFAGLSFGSFANNPFIINWVDAIHPDNTTDGVMALVTFRVKEGATGTAAITLTYEAEDVYDQNYDNVAFRVENGSVTVVEYTPGDVNNDGKINNKDLGMLQQYVNEWEVAITQAADCNGDGRINNKDLGLLQQYVNEWDVDLG